MITSMLAYRKLTIEMAIKNNKYSYSTHIITRGFLQYQYQCYDNHHSMINKKLCRYQSSLKDITINDMNNSSNKNTPPSTSISSNSQYQSNQIINDEKIQQKVDLYNNSKQISLRKKMMNKVKVYLELGKYKLSALVVVTSGFGFICSGSFDATIFSACIGTALCAASAGTFNQVLERHKDALMKRTRVRPLPSHRVSVLEAVSFGVLAGSSGVGLLYSLNPTCAILGLSNILLYAGPYTLSKPYTELNTWIGSVVGAVPPLIGWAAATQGTLSAPDPVFLALILYYWQFPHFFALSWLHREDYARGNFQMVAVNDPLGMRTANLIIKYTCYLSTLPILASVLGVTSYMFALEGTLLNMYLLYLSHQFSEDQSNARARKVFLTTLWYLPLLLAAFVLHNHNWDKINQNLTNLVPSPLVLQFQQMKAFMRQQCLHEILFQNKQSFESKDNETRDSHIMTTSLFCPVAQAVEVKEKATDILVISSDQLDQRHPVNSSIHVATAKKEGG